MFYKKNSSYMIDRLLEFTNRLYNGEELSINQLINEFDDKITKRTLQRDFKLLSDKLPIKKENGFWKLKNNFLNHEDLMIIETIENFLNSQDKQFQIKARKLLNQINQSQTNVFYTKLNLEDLSSNLQEISKIELAIKNKNIINFTYQSYESNFLVTINPLKILNNQGFWYLLGYSTKEKIIKKYYLKSISKVKILSKNYRISRNISNFLNNAINIWFDSTNKPFMVKLYVSKEYAKFFISKKISNTQSIEHNTDGSINLLIQITHEMEILPLIKSLMPHLRVIEPTWINELIQKDIQKYLKIKTE